VGIGDLPPGPHNAITDVPGVEVGHATVTRDQPTVIRTGVTMVVPRPDIWSDYVFAAWHNFSGNGEMTGLPWVEESGLIGAPIGITNTHQVGLVRDFIIRRAEDRCRPGISSAGGGGDLGRVAKRHRGVRAHRG
jgi:D-aminopeptidase